ncbi:TRAUB-domain-containing protein [Heliocybe sulcata]|uniref:Protein BFR2 n=1 Tax=Heliocybe sulcata TaxID=5364 RepID=A0A5C3N1Q5_9AGAM|nr:TRAUB-domain-containing protein [Heliocybe sulcata]
MASSRLSLAQQIAQLEETAPIDVDPEDIHDAGREPQEQEAESGAGNTAAREHYLDVGPSAIRRLHDSIADTKYEGVRTSRKQLLEEDEDEDEGHDPSGNEGDDVQDPSDQEEEEEIPSESVSEGDEVDDLPPPRSVKSSPGKANGPRPSKLTPAPAEDLSSTLRQTREEDRKKGKAVSRQLALWDSILDARIRLQKAATAANRLPLPDDMSSYATHPDVKESLNKMMDEALFLSGSLFEFQETLLTTNDIISPPPRKRRRIGDNHDHHGLDYDSALREASEASGALEHAYHPYLVQTLTKWSAKVQAVAPSVLLPSSRNAFSRNQNHVKSAVQLVEEALADRAKLRARTRVRRGGKPRIAHAEEGQDTEQNLQDKEDQYVFDDTDFYQQLLRDIISNRTGDSSLGGAAYPNQKANKSKQKKKAVDTKASKGRKLRYEVHEKLQNFMVPVPKGGWHEEQIDELFASLLGRGFEDAPGVGAGGMDVDGLGGGGDLDVDRRRLEKDAERAVQEGFRVFG